MKNILATSLILAACASAQAAEIPAKYRGEWCDHISGNYYMRFHLNMCKRKGIGYMRVTASRYEYGFGGEPSNCRVVKTAEKEHRAPIGNGMDHLMTFACSVEEDKNVPLTLLFYTTPGKYGHDVRLYIEETDIDEGNK